MTEMGDRRGKLRRKVRISGGEDSEEGDKRVIRLDGISLHTLKTMKKVYRIKSKAGTTREAYIDSCEAFLTKVKINEGRAIESFLISLASRSE